MPTVSDRIAQTVIKTALEPRLEQVFHPDSYGYRPGKSAKDALQTARARCWKYDWVLEYDISQFFEDIDHDLLMRALGKHVNEKWILLYVERWLKAPTQVDGELIQRTRGTPQGGVVSPLLANLFLHYVFDLWMTRNHPGTPFERYADDGLVHCVSREQAERVKADLMARFGECGLKLHPTKTQIVYCKDSDREQDYPVISFDFLGYCFRPRRSKNRWGKYFVNFSPAISNKAAKAIRREIRSWRLHERSDKSLRDLAYMFNRKLRGWINYYTAFYKSALYPSLRHLDRKLVLWATRKFKKLRGHRRRATRWLDQVIVRDPVLFAHWKLLHAKAG